MIRNSFKRIVPFVLVLLVLLTLPLNVGAEGLDFGKTGNIKIQLRDAYAPDTPIGGALVLHKVGDAKEGNGSLTFALSAAFSGSGVSLTDVNAPDLAAQLAAYATEKKLEGKSAQADTDGYAAFSGLSTGLYLVMQTEAVEGYLPVAPFLVSLPMYNAGNDSWIYSIEAAPKVQRPSKDPVSVTVVKKWQDNNIKRPESLDIRLLRDGVIVETVTVTADDDWKYTWTGLDAYYTWTVEEVIPEGYSASYSVHNGTTTITNKAYWYKPPKDDMIQTGQLNWPVPVLICTGLFLVLTGCILVRRGKQSV